MIIYAQLNKNNVCIGIAQLAGEVTDTNMVELQSADADKLWRKYENGVWSTDKYEPNSTAPLDVFTSLKATVDQLVLDSLK